MSNQLNLTPEETRAAEMELVADAQELQHSIEAATSKYISKLHNNPLTESTPYTKILGIQCVAFGETVTNQYKRTRIDLTAIEGTLAAGNPVPTDDENLASEFKFMQAADANDDTSTQTYPPSPQAAHVNVERQFGELRNDSDDEQLEDE
ncbi:hypothetical protein HDV00_011506 [Rhizophlyctis rosea]|nr:hypothetical protein HDV00_011506 [Rhizophlyctis rosea]